MLNDTKWKIEYRIQMHYEFMERYKGSSTIEQYYDFINEDISILYQLDLITREEMKLRFKKANEFLENLKDGE